MPRAYITLGLPRILHVLQDIPGITRIWRSTDGEQYWIAVENRQHESTIAARLGDAVDQVTDQAGGANVVFLFNLVLPGASGTVPADAQVCWPAPAGRPA